GLERLLTGFVHNLAALLLATSVSLSFYQVITRFVFGHPSVWSEVAARSIMIWFVFLGCAAAFRMGAMIAVELVYRLLPRRLLVPVYSVVTLLTFLALVILAWQGYKMTLRVQLQALAGIWISIAWVYAAIPVGAAFCIVAVLARFVEVVRDPERLLFSETVAETA
ncbi:MAG: TRAP transporter small permease, partial [Deinococcota bacterium]|nr:TRAP transporter small permease [Deinococcota bacterium]